MVSVDEINAGDIGAFVGVWGIKSGETFIEEHD